MYNIKQYLKKMFGVLDLKKSRLVVSCWTNPAREKLYHQSVDFMLNASTHELERQSDGRFPAWPEGVIFLNGKGRMGSEEIEVVFDPKRVRLEEIVVYLAKVGLDVRKKKVES